MVLFDWLTDNDDEPPLHRLLIIILLLHYHNSIRNHHYLHRSANPELQRSPWKKLYKNGDMTSFLHMMGLTCCTFGLLLDYLFDLEEIASRYRCGWPCSLHSDGYLGLLLFYLGSKMQYGHLCLIFGITPSICSRVINMMLKWTVQYLRDHPFARVQFPDDAKMRDFANMVQRREPMVDDILGFIDQVSFPVQCTDKQISQNAMYCGYDYNTMVNNVFAYGPDGKVVFAAINSAGSCWADGSLTGYFLHYVKRKIGAYKICVDQGFPQSGDAHGTFVGLVTKWQVQRLHCDIQNYLLKISNGRTLLRQASKWGMYGLQGRFPHIKSCLPSNSVQRHLILKAIILVHNFHTDYVGYSQIKTVFDREYVRCKNLHGYDRIAQYYFCPGDCNSKVDKAVDGVNESNKSSNNKY
jgi:hypothetical protein